MRSVRPIAAAFITATSILGSATAQQLVRDIAQSPVPPSSGPRNFTATPTFAGFTAATAEAGTEPWVTNATAAGTFRLRDLAPGPSYPVMVCEYQGNLLFRAQLQNETRLFVSDGTPAGTTVVDNLGIELTAVAKLGNGKLLATSANLMYATDLTSAGTILIPGMTRFTEGISVGGVSYGTCQLQNGTYELWRTDGTAAGSALVGTVVGQVSGYLDWNNRIYFYEAAFLGTAWLSSTDGTSIVHHVTLPPMAVPTVDRMFVRNNGLCFERAGSLIVSDLTQTGTHPLSVPCTDIRNMVEYGGNLHFRATNASLGYELWQTDGTAAGTTIVADLMPGSPGSHPEHFLPTANGLYFRALLPAGRHLMRLNNASSITDLGAIPDNAPNGVAVTNPISGFVPFQGGLLFAGTDATGDELWFYDGTNPPGRLLDIATDGESLRQVENGPTQAIGDRMYFTAYDGVSGDELWYSDGTNAGTQLLDLTPGAGSEFEPATGSMARYGERLAFTSRNRVAITDGTQANTQPLIPPSTSAFEGPVRSYGPDLWFVRNSRLYHSDGTAAGTTQLPFTSTTTILDFEVLTNRVVVGSITAVHGTDGTGYPQFLFALGGTRSFYRIRDDRVVVVGDSGMWATDSTPAGSTQLANFTAWPQHGAMRNGKVYQITYLGFYETDGTIAGTTQLATLPANMMVTSLIVTDHDQYLVASTPATGRELWKLDRNLGQFVLVSDIAPGVYSGVLEAKALGCGDLVFVAAGDDPTGIEPYVTDGTANGTRLLADIHPGRGNSNPSLLGVADDKIFMIADDGVHGRELWTIPLALSQAASVQEFGQACLGSAGLPHLGTADVPRAGSTFDLDLANVRSLTLCALGLANQHASTPFGSCELLLSGSIATVVTNANVAGAAHFALPLPATPQLLGVRFVTQGFALDNAVPGGFTASDGVIFVAGR